MIKDPGDGLAEPEPEPELDPDPGPGAGTAYGSAAGAERAGETGASAGGCWVTRSL
ncbi:hypothetical protein GCM10027091_59720 [Streptomyces daliensis]